MEYWGSHQLKWIKVFNNKTNEKANIDCAWLFYAIWHRANTDFLWWQLALDEWGCIKVTWINETSVKWVFAAWDVIDKNTPFRQAIVAAWSWCKAALKAEQFLKEN